MVPILALIFTDGQVTPARLAAAGVPVRLEPAPDSGELFPHLYGALPLEAVVLAEAYP